MARYHGLIKWQPLVTIFFMLRNIITFALVSAFLTSFYCLHGVLLTTFCGTVFTTTYVWNIFNRLSSVLWNVGYRRKKWGDNDNCLLLPTETDHIVDKLDSFQTSRCAFEFVSHYLSFVLSRLLRITRGISFIGVLHT